MSSWPGKYVIGLTGNIATGKSVVRRMLEHLGAYGIDADALGHRSIARDAPGYQPVIDVFGSWILSQDRQIDRTKLSRVVFADPDAMAKLEAIVHPLVRQAIDMLVKRSSQKVIVVEAIKLLESPLRQACDVIWVAYAPQEVQTARLRQKRGMSETSARQRIEAQSSQEEKIRVANVVIRNQGSFNDTWKQVSAAWKDVAVAIQSPLESPEVVVKAEFGVQRARPGQANEIATLITRLSNDRQKLTHDDVMAAFSEKAFLLLKKDAQIVGVAGWQVENLIARTDSIYIEVTVPFEKAVRVLMDDVERASRELQCEVSLLFIAPEMTVKSPIWGELGYKEGSIQSLGVRAWQEAALESMPEGSKMYYKQLRADRVLHPV